MRTNKSPAKVKVLTSWNVHMSACVSEGNIFLLQFFYWLHLLKQNWIFWTFIGNKAWNRFMIEVFFCQLSIHRFLFSQTPIMNVIHRISKIIFWCVFQYSYHMESLQIIDKFCSSPLVIFLSIKYIFQHSHKNGQTFHLLCISYHHDLAMLCVFT